MSTLYNTAIVDNDNRDKPTFVDVGIHDNIKLVNVRSEISKNNNPFLSFDFENEKGDRLFKTLWEVKSKKPLQEMTEQEKSNFEYRIKCQIGLVKQIIETFVPKGSYKEAEVNSFKEFADWVVSTLGNSYKEQKIRVKVVYDNRNFATLPDNINSTFIENMCPKEESKIRLLPTDKMERVLPDKELYRQNSLTSSTVEDKSNNDLLF
jgi:hypothetical protein